ncbi:MAG: zinc ribbon domain-containing protein, partial [Lachnospiraceae bacterium]|nr:zinc ribbon domain-containing protein [Lachnospiraceae bacterium]
MKCKKCGKEIENAVFCPHCGTKVEGLDVTVIDMTKDNDTVKEEKATAWDKFTYIRWWLVSVSGILAALFCVSQGSIPAASLCIIAGVIMCPLIQVKFTWGKQVIIRIVGIILVVVAAGIIATSGENEEHVQ